MQELELRWRRKNTAKEEKESQGTTLSGYQNSLQLKPSAQTVLLDPTISDISRPCKSCSWCANCTTSVLESIQPRCSITQDTHKGNIHWFASWIFPKDSYHILSVSDSCGLVLAAPSFLVPRSLVQESFKRIKLFQSGTITHTSFFFSLKSSQCLLSSFKSLFLTSSWQPLISMSNLICVAFQWRISNPLLDYIHLQEVILLVLCRYSIVGIQSILAEWLDCYSSKT